MPPKKLPPAAVKIGPEREQEVVYTLELTLGVSDVFDTDVREVVREAFSLLRQVGGCEVVKVSPEAVEVKPPELDS